MEKNHSKTLGLSIHQERLRERINFTYQKYEPSLTATCTPNSSSIPNKENMTPIKNQCLERSRVNWIKYNILVSIYQNWLRLEPFVRYWLEKTYQNQKEKSPLPCDYLRRARMEGQPQSGRKKEQQLDIFDEMRLRRDELLKGMDPSDADMEYLAHARQLARQLLSTLPIQNNKWTKIRIEKQNRLLDEMIRNFNQDEFHMNSEAIIHSIKERIYFIDEMQKKFIDVSKEQQNMLQEKLELLKKPFKKVFSKNKKHRIQPETLFENLWHEIESERTKLLTKKPELRHTFKRFRSKQRYAILQKSQSEGLVVKYHLKHGDYFNQTYVRTKYRKSRSRKTKNRSKNGLLSADESLQGLKAGEITKDSVQEMADDRTHSNSTSSRGLQQEQEAINAQFVEDFMRRQKLKPTYREQNPNFFKKTPTKFEGNYSHYRPSISYIDGRSNKDTDMSGIRTGNTISRDRTSLFARRDSRHRPSGQQITQKEDHLSRFRSHKKLITLKSIGGVSRHTKLNKEQGRKDSQLDSLNRISSKLSRLQKKQFRREPVDFRKGVFHKKGTQRKEISIDEELSIVPQNLHSLNRQEFLNYFNKILGAGHLDQERYQNLKEQVKTLVKKNQASALQETHAYVEKLVERSAEDQYRCLLGEGRQQTLSDLFDVVRRDERIRSKIREQMKIFFSNESVEECCSEDSICNQQFLYNTTELRKVNQELKRIVCFKAEGESISLANRLTKEYNSLEQRSI